MNMQWKGRPHSRRFDFCGPQALLTAVAELALTPLVGFGWSEGRRHPRIPECQTSEIGRHCNSMLSQLNRSRQASTEPSRSCITRRRPSSPARPPDARGKCARPAHQRQNDGWVFGRIGAAGLRTQGKSGDEQQGKYSGEQDSFRVHSGSLSVLVSSKVVRSNVIGAGLRIIVIRRGLRLVAIAVLHGDLPVIIVRGVQAACRRASAAGGIDAPS